MSAGIVCTIGPATNSRESLLDLRNAGMTVARLNGSHNTVEWHAETIRTIRNTIPDIPILLDIPGRKIRTTELEHEPSFEQGDRIILTTDTSHNGFEKVPVSYPDLHLDLSVGNIIYADDGTLSFEVVEISGQDITVVAHARGKIRSRKGINVPFVKLKTQLVTDRDREVIEFAKTLKVDFIGISFVESAFHVDKIREVINGSSPRIVAKIENQGGLHNVTEIAEAADAIMIDRGDLSVETSLARTAIFQKRILREANACRKPVIVATEMLHSMISSPNPTKAEVSDIANAVIDGCAATMLSGETAIGKYPVQAVSMMKQISEESARIEDDDAITTSSIPESMSSAIRSICRSFPITKIVAVTKSGFAARMIAAQRPRQPILAISNDESAARSFNLFYGTLGVYFDIPFSKKSTDHIAACLKELYVQGLVADDDTVLITSLAYPNSGNRMNILEIHNISDLKSALEW